jgi:hypothetical protein
MDALTQNKYKEYLLKKFNIKEPKVFSHYTKNIYTMNWTINDYDNWDIKSHREWLKCLLLIESDIKIKCNCKNIIIKTVNSEYEYNYKKTNQYNFRVDILTWTTDMYENYKQFIIPSEHFFYFILLKAEQIDMFNDFY